MEIIRNLARRKLRSSLTISGIVIGIFALTTMGSMAEHFNALLDGGAKYFASNVQIGAPDGQQAALLPLSKMNELKNVQGVDAVYPSYSVPLRPGGGFVSFEVPDTIANDNPGEGSRILLKTSLARGHGLTADSRGEVVLGTSGAGFPAIPAGAALLALVIGGLSVVNTMIMAVTERVREIGLKKAVGAHTGHILREYMTEATLIGLVVPVLGHRLGLGLAHL